MDPNTILRMAYRRIGALVDNVMANQPAHEPACTSYLAKGLEQIVNVAINARADARSKVEATGGDGWWPVG